jgi:hypothetical protein
LLRRREKDPKEVTRKSFTTRTLWLDAKAFYENKRYVDVDLNRSFLKPVYPGFINEAEYYDQKIAFIRAIELLYGYEYRGINTLYGSGVFEAGLRGLLIRSKASIEPIGAARHFSDKIIGVLSENSY